MNDQPPKKPALHQLPAILTGAAALIASLTAVYVNVRGDRNAAPAPQVQSQASQAAAKPAAATAPAKEAPRAVDRWRVNVDRISVQDDGSPGDTDWRFTIEADDDALFAFQQDGLDDTGGRNVAVPKDAGGVLRLDGRDGVRITIQGWRGRLINLGGKPDAVGEGRMTRNGAIGPIRVAAPEASGGSFVFHLSADPAE